MGDFTDNETMFVVGNRHVLPIYTIQVIVLY